MSETEHETIAPAELAETAAAAPEPITFDPDAERENAAAASAASRQAAVPRRPGPPPRDPDAPADPRRMLVKAMNERYGQVLDEGVDTGKYTATVVPMGALADVALAHLSNLPPVPPYDQYDSPRERFYDHRVPELDPDEYFIPSGGHADMIGPGAMPVGQSLGFRRRGDIVEVAVRPAGGAEQDPVATLELPLAQAQAAALALLSATWADPVDESANR